MDLWALGCVIYEMISGMKPFDEVNEKDPIKMTSRIIEKIWSKEFQWKKENEKGHMVEIFSDNARDIIEKLCSLQPEIRLGAGQNGSPQDFKSLKSHPWFKIIQKDYQEIDLSKLFQLQVPLEKHPRAPYAT